MRPYSCTCITHLPETPTIASGQAYGQRSPLVTSSVPVPAWACAPLLKGLLHPKHVAILLAGMLIMAGLIAFLFGMLVPWWEGLQAQWHYGDSRVTQFDANVGHEGESHFTAYYHDGQVVVIEFPHDGDGTRTHVYAHRYVVHDRTSRLVTLKTKRLSGKPILVVSVEGVALPFVLYDTGTQYSVTPN